MRRYLGNTNSISESSGAPGPRAARPTSSAPLRLALLIGLAFVLFRASPLAAAPTMGLLLKSPAASEGYTLFEAMLYPEAYLIDNQGRLVHSWQVTKLAGNMTYLLENGDLLRGARIDGIDGFDAPGGAGMIQRYDWDGNLVWEFVYNTTQVRYHHDVAALPNGNVLVLAWEVKTEAEAIQAGRDPASIGEGEIWPEHIVEVEPVGATGGNIVWEWHVWDHLVQDFDATKDNFGVVADHPELVNVNFRANTNADWLHANAIAYDPDLDQIVISLNTFREFWVIDHSTSSAEAAGHTGGARGMGGDILYRWGNPRAYDRGMMADQKLFNQHDVHWIAAGLPGAGNLLLFNNGNARPGGSYSTVEEIETPVDANGDYPVPPPGVPHGPLSPTWTYTATPPGELYSSFISGADRMPNGNTLICEGATGDFHEVDAASAEVWRYICPVNDDGPMIQGTVPSFNRVFRVRRYAPDYPAFDGRDLTPGDPIEIDATGVGPGIGVALSAFELRQNFPNPFRPFTTIGFTIDRAAPVSLRIYDVGGRSVATLVNGTLGEGAHTFTWRPDGLPSGVYHYTLQVDGETASRRMVVLR